MKNIIIVFLLGVIGFLVYDYNVKPDNLGMDFWRENEETLYENIKNEKEEQSELNQSYEYLKVPTYEYIKIPFETVNWDAVTPIDRSFGDVWFYTEENHNELIENDFDWTKNDVLLLYITNQQYRGHEIIVKELTISTAPLGIGYNLVIDFKKVNDSEEPAKIYIVIPKDSLRKEDGELRLNYSIYDTNGNMIPIYDDSDY